MKKLSKLLVLILTVLLLCTACSGAKSAEAPAAMYDAAGGDQSFESQGMAYSTTGNTNQNGAAPKQQTAVSDADTRKIVYNADMSVTADLPAKALEEVCSKAVSLGGYVANSYTNNDDEGAVRCSVTLKVPADRLNELVTAAETTGTVNSYSLNSDDISLSYYDIQARLNNAKAEEAQLLIVLAECTTVEDILSVRESLTQLRGDIESYQAQINLWDNLVDYATLELSIRRTEKTPVAGEKKLTEIWKASDVWARMKYGFQNSARFMVNALGAMGIFLAAIFIPAVILFALIGVPIILVRRRKRQKAAERAANGEPFDSAATDRKAERAKRKAEKKALKEQRRKKDKLQE